MSETTIDATLTEEQIARKYITKEELHAKAEAEGIDLSFVETEEQWAWVMLNDGSLDRTLWDDAAYHAQLEAEADNDQDGPERYTDEDYDRFELEDLRADEARYLAEYAEEDAKRARFEEFKASGKWSDDYIKSEVTVDWDSLSDHDKEVYTVKHRIALASYQRNLEKARRDAEEAPVRVKFYEECIADVIKTGPVYMTNNPCY